MDKNNRYKGQTQDEAQIDIFIRINNLPEFVKDRLDTGAFQNAINECINDGIYDESALTQLPTEQLNKLRKLRDSIDNEILQIQSRIKVVYHVLDR